MTSDAAIIVMAKQPLPGLSKTRLCPPFTFEEAAGLYEALLLDTFELVRSVKGIALAVGVSPLNAVDYFRAVTPAGTLLLPVEAPDIGGCLSQVLEQLFQMGFRKAIALNSDGPSLPPEYLDRALELLDDHDVVFGPADDGGYYLVGLTRLQPDLFNDIPWSTERVLSASLARAAALGLRAAQTPPWYDVDTAASVRFLARELPRLPENTLPFTHRFLALLRPVLRIE